MSAQMQEYAFPTGQMAVAHIFAAAFCPRAHTCTHTLAHSKLTQVA